MGHSQFAELIGARGPNTQINSACASTTQAVAAGRGLDPRRSLPARRRGRRRRCHLRRPARLDRRRLPGLRRGRHRRRRRGGRAAVRPAPPRDDPRAWAPPPSSSRARTRRASAASSPICEVLGTVTANSAFHGTRLDVDHIGQRDGAGRRAGRDGAAALRASEMAPQTVFVSHETYTPARGGSAAAEIHALRAVFGADADRIVIANTKGFTGHPMGVGHRGRRRGQGARDRCRAAGPELPRARSRARRAQPLARAAPIRSSTRCGLAPGFGSQISMTLLRWTPTPDGRAPSPMSSATPTGSPTRVGVERVARARQRPREPSSRSSADPARGGPRPADALCRRSPPRRAAALRRAGAGRRRLHRAAAPAEPALPDAVAASDRRRGSACSRSSAEKTGYPPDLLDTGPRPRGGPRDRHRQAGGGVRGHPRGVRDRARRQAEAARLPDAGNHVVAFVRDRRPDVAAAGSAESAAAPAAAPVTSGCDRCGTERVLAIVAEKTGYPPDLLDTDLDLEADLGIDTSNT